MEDNQYFEAYDELCAEGIGNELDAWHAYKSAAGMYRELTPKELKEMRI
jgi:hypothetical protein